MQKRQKQKAAKHRQTVGNLALADESWEWDYQRPQADHRQLRAAKQRLDFDPFAPAQGIMNGLIISMILWGAAGIFTFLLSQP